MIDAPSEKCLKCNWWLLLKEIKEEMDMKLCDHTERGCIKNKHINPILSLYARSAYKVVKEHWDGKR